MTMVRLPTSLLTGFLGSGKTTLLSQWLRAPEFRDTAVIINEAGAVQIDGTLVGRANENVRVLEGGCLCCKVLDDLSSTIVRLLDAREDGSIPAFSRLVIETSGLADPGPISSSLMCDPRLSSRIRLTPTITVLDGVNGVENLERYPEARTQVLHAGQVIVTKIEHLDSLDRERIESAVRRTNPHAEVIWSSRQAPAAPPTELERKDTAFTPVAVGLGGGSMVLRASPRVRAAHDHSQLQAYAFRFGQPIDGASLIEAIDLMEQLFEGQIVRSKSLFFDSQTECGYVMHSVNGTLDTPEEIGGLDVTKTGLVVFTSGVPQDRLRAVIAPFVSIH
jgi:G3E family GTPase